MNRIAQTALRVVGKDNALSALKYAGKYIVPTVLAPIAAADLAASLTSEGISLVQDLWYRGTGQAFNDEIGGALNADKMARARHARLQMLARLRSENEARIAAMDPHLHSELLAGQRLPPGAVVFGGRPNRDLLDEVTLGMAQGDFAQPENGFGSV